MERLTTDDEKSMFYCFNLFYAKDNEIWVRGGGPEPDYQDVSLVQWIKRAATEHQLNIDAENAESLGDEMYDALQDGSDTVEGIVALLHAAAVQATEMRHRLKSVEDILDDDYDLDRLRELMEADRDGRCVVLPIPLHRMLFDVSDPYRPEVLKDFRISATWTHNGIVFHSPWNIFLQNVEKGYIRLMKESAEAALKGGNHETDPV